ncbi:Hypothetical predicted protein [Drosophila guanche]|uniref:Uncharacterized protein n=1 Tax=Drosophila guanche TaxID=7266 RepID=A0A3B0JSV2_DROGU|nr:Hypothetical predicted protein [Drosophila guanche]
MFALAKEPAGQPPASIHSYSWHPASSIQQSASSAKDGVGSGMGFASWTRPPPHSVGKSDAQLTSNNHDNGNDNDNDNGNDDMEIRSFCVLPYRVTRG